MKRLAGFSTLALMISATSGCGWLWGDEGYFRDRGSDYLAARPTAPMQLPPNVDARRLDPLLPIPAGVADSTQREGKFEVPRPQALQVEARPSEFSLQNSADSRWLVAQRSPAEVWPLVRQFFSDNGFEVAEERPRTGEFVTDWQAASELQGDISSRVGSLIDDAETRLRVRVEPGVQRNTSEVFVLSAQRPAGSTAEPGWSATGGNAALESALLDELLASVNRSGEGGSVSLLAARDYDAPSRTILSVDGSGNPLLTLDTDLDRAWSSVGRALEQASLRVEDVDRGQGLYFVNLAERPEVVEEEPGFFSRMFSSEPDKEEVDARAERYRVRLSQVGRRVQVTVEQDINTVAPADVARRILEQVRDRLG